MLRWYGEANFFQKASSLVAVLRWTSTRSGGNGTISRNSVVETGYALFFRPHKLYRHNGTAVEAAAEADAAAAEATAAAATV